MSRRVIAVSPRQEYARRAKLFRALEAVHACNFEPVADGAFQPCDGIIRFESQPHDDRFTCPSLTFTGGGAAVAAGEVQLADDSALDHCLRRQTLTEAHATLHPLEPRDGERVLASCRGLPLWLVDKSGYHHVAGVAPAEVNDGEALRSQLRPGRFLALLPLLHFVRQIEGDLAWVPPPLRATFIIDDPSIRRRRYGYIDFAAFRAHAARSRYHVSFATIPLDLGAAHTSTLALFRQNPEHLSLTVHGNDHTRYELLAADSEARSLQIAAQALLRADCFEARFGLRIDRAMVPPHSRASTSSRRALNRLGYDALIMYTPEQRSADPAAANGLLAGWEPAQMVAGEAPLIVRHHLPFAEEWATFDDAVLSAYLGLPLIFSGHHWDFRDGLEQLDAFAQRVNGIGDVRWMSPQAICRTNYAVRREGQRLRLRLYSRRVEVADSRDMELVPEWRGKGECNETVVSGPPQAGGVRVLSLRPDNAMGANQVRLPSTSVWPRVRRVMTEIRDRMQPLTDAMRSTPPAGQLRKASLRTETQG